MGGKGATPTPEDETIYKYNIERVLDTDIQMYGSEAWMMTQDVRRAINGANSRMVTVITGRSPHEEAKEGTRSFDLVRAIRAGRLAWLGHILRMSPTRMLAQAVTHMHNNRSEGDILSDAPKTQSWEEL